MATLVQVELQTGNTHTVCWVEASLKPQVGMSLTRKGDPREWSIAKAYLLASREMDGIEKVWKVGTPECHKS